jgi:hypothetical protein
MKCQRCKVTYYCSKQCQIADWKIHKKRCNELGSYVEERSALPIALSSEQITLISQKKSTRKHRNTASPRRRYC